MPPTRLSRHAQTRRSRRTRRPKLQRPRRLGPPPIMRGAARQRAILRRCIQVPHTRRCLSRTPTCRRTPACLTMPRPPPASGVQATGARSRTAPPCSRPPPPTPRAAWRVWASRAPLPAPSPRTTTGHSCGSGTCRTTCAGRTSRTCSAGQALCCVQTCTSRPRTAAAGWAVCSSPPKRTLCAHWQCWTDTRGRGACWTCSLSTSMST